MVTAPSKMEFFHIVTIFDLGSQFPSIIFFFFLSGSALSIRIVNSQLAYLYALISK